MVKPSRFNSYFDKIVILSNLVNNLKGFDWVIKCRKLCLRQTLVSSIEVKTLILRTLVLKALDHNLFLIILYNKLCYYTKLIIYLFFKLIDQSVSAIFNICSTGVPFTTFSILSLRINITFLLIISLLFRR